MPKFKFELNVKPSPIDTRDWVSETVLPSKRSISAPKTLDLRDQLQRVRDQGNQGSCAAQTAACMKEYQEKLDVGINEYMSPQFVYNNRSGYPESGMYGRDVMKILRNVGCCTEKSYPYGTIESKDDIGDEVYEEAQKYVIGSYAQVNTVDGLKVALCTNGPCYVSFPVYNYSKTFWKPEDGDEMEGGHAVTIVGYNKDGFIIRNSWGTTWGDKGYTVYPYDHFGMHWEIWTTVDSDSSQVEPKKKRFGCF